MSELLEKIRSRGYWKVVIRPHTFVEKRVANRSELLHILQKASVGMKGWNFPHIDGWGKPDEGPDWIAQEISWDYILELWRFYQSGQFVHYFGMPEDWDDRSRLPLPLNDGVPRVALDVKDVILRFTEIFELAARLTFTDAGDEALRIDIKVENIEDHFLILPEFGSKKPSWIPQARKPYMHYKKDVSKIELVAEKRELALTSALKLFECFQWSARIELLRDLQDQLVRRGSAVI